MLLDIIRFNGFSHQTLLLPNRIDSINVLWIAIILKSYFLKLLVLQIWNGYDGFWQNGAVLEPMVNFIAYTNHTHTRYKQMILGSERGLYSLLEAYGPYPSFDDMAW